MTGRVYITNCGEGNALWPIAKAHDTLIMVDNTSIHPFWQVGDREGYVEAAMTTTLTALNKRPSRQTAGRWYNLVEEMRDTEDDIWISRQGDAIWWTISQAGDLREELHPSTNPKRDGPSTWHIEKPCLPWSDRGRQGRALRWEALHPKARHFLSTEATFQTIANDRGYADYARALVNGDPLEPWHSLPLFKERAAAAKKQGVRMFSPKELAAARMAEMMLQTVAQANGQTVDRRVKEKLTTLDRQACERLILLKAGEQEDRCALSGLPLGYDGDCEDKELLASLDRIDSDGHYTPDNVQIVCRFINRWKGADDDLLTRRLLGLLRT